VTGMEPDQKDMLMNKREYLYECSRLSNVMAEKSDALENFKRKHKDLLDESIFEEFDALQLALSSAIGEWQSFCDNNRHKVVG
jgi:hypothetical protein